MAYAAWSVTFGEQPSSAKWNILGANDASFNNGTGIAALEIGAVTAVKNSYKFSAFHATTQSLATNALVGFNTELFDTGNNYDGINKFTAPIAGYYQVNANIFIAAANSVLNAIEIYKNGAFLDYGQQAASSGSGDLALSYSNLIKLAATDYLQVVVAFSGGGSKTIFGGAGTPHYTWFSGYLVSAT